MIYTDLSTPSRLLVLLTVYVQLSATLDPRTWQTPSQNTSVFTEMWTTTAEVPSKAVTTVTPGKMLGAGRSEGATSILSEQTVLSGTTTSEQTVLSGAATSEQAILSGMATSEQTVLSGTATSEQTVLSGTLTSEQTVLSGMATSEQAILSRTTTSEQTVLSGTATSEQAVLSGTATSELAILSGTVTSEHTLLSGTSTLEYDKSSMGQPVLTKTSLSLGLRGEEDCQRKSSLFCCLDHRDCTTVGIGVLSENSEEANLCNTESDPDKFNITTLHQKVFRWDKGDETHKYGKKLSLPFVDRCPAKFSDQNITAMCQISLTDDENLKLVHLIPVMSRYNNITVLSRNIFCAICNNLDSNPQLTLTLRCPRGPRLGADSRLQNLPHVARLCQAVIGFTADNEHLSFLYTFGEVKYPNTLDRYGERHRNDSSDQCRAWSDVCQNGCACYQNIFQIPNCREQSESDNSRQDSDYRKGNVTGSAKAHGLKLRSRFGNLRKRTKLLRVKDDMLSDGEDLPEKPQNDTNSDMDTENRMSTEMVVKSVGHPENELLDKTTTSCTELGTATPEVCLKTSWRFRQLQQLVYVTCMAAGSGDNSSTPDLLYGNAEIMALITSQLSGLKPKTLSVKHGNPTTLSLETQNTVMYENLASPFEIFDAIKQVRQANASRNCVVSGVSKLSTCIHGNKEVEDAIFKGIKEIGLFKDLELVLINESPCQPKGTEHQGPLSELNCQAVVQISLDDFQKLKRSSEFQPNEPAHVTVEDRVWVCANWLLNHNKALSSKADEPIDKGESWATLVCSSISMTALAVTFVCKLVVHKLVSLPVKLMMNLMVSLFISQALLLLMAVENETWCTVVAILSHYFWLATFCWMFICAFHMFKTFSSSAFTAINSISFCRAVLTYGVFGYSVPLLFVLPAVVIHFCACVDITIGYGRDVCFIREPIANIVTFAGPIALVIVLNGILLGCTFYQIKKTSDAVQCAQTMNIKSYKIFIKISSLFGFTWVFGYIAILTSIDIIWYIFTVLNSLQGLYIFMSFGFRDVKIVFKKMLSALHLPRRGSGSANSGTTGWTPNSNNQAVTGCDKDTVTKL